LFKDIVQIAQLYLFIATMVAVIVAIIITYISESSYKRLETCDSK